MGSFEKVLTIVVPSYNTEPYIDECLPSILSASNISEAEVLLINDGSTDGTLQLLRRYPDDYPDVVRVIDKQNGGHGSVLNRGVVEARGKYYKVYDGDDWADTAGLERLIDALKTCNDDVVVTNYRTYNIANQKSRDISYGRQTGSCPIGKALASLPGEITLHAVAFKTNLLRDNDIHFAEHCFYEDTEYIMYPMAFAHSVSFIDCCAYIYRIGSPTQSVNPKKAFHNREMLQRIVKNCIGFYEKYESACEPEVREYIAHLVTSRVVTSYNVFFKVPASSGVREQLKEWDAEMRQLSEPFYRRANVFPINLLRLNIALFYRPVSWMYGVFYRLRARG